MKRGIKGWVHQVSSGHGIGLLGILRIGVANTDMRCILAYTGFSGRLRVFVKVGQYGLCRPHCKEEVTVTRSTYLMLSISTSVIVLPNL